MTKDSLYKRAIAVHPPTTKLDSVERLHHVLTRFMSIDPTSLTSSETYQCLQHNGVSNYDHFQMLTDDDIMSLDYKDLNGNVVKLYTIARHMLVIAKSYPK